MICYIEIPLSTVPAYRRKGGAKGGGLNVELQKIILGFLVV